MHVRHPLILIALSATACTAAGPPSTGFSQIGREIAPRQVTTLTAIVRVEPNAAASRPVRVTTEPGRYLTERMFNANISVLDDQARPHPYLVEALPELNTSSWRLQPDGSMETSYRLRGNLTWHDGAQLTSDDFVFSWQVYATPTFGLSSAPPFGSIDSVTASDERTFVIRWARPYPDAGVLAGRGLELPALPRHILDEAFRQDQPDAFMNHPYWGREFVGLGPYRLSRWEPGAFLQTDAFDGHALGRPHIDSIKVSFVSDANAALSSMLAGEAQLAADNVLSTEQAVTLRQTWSASVGQGAGNVIFHPNQWRAIHFQFRPELMSPRSLQDERVRKALAYAVDKTALDEGAYGSFGIHADSMFPRESLWGPVVDRAITKYPLDLRRSEELMKEAGFALGRDGIYAGLAGPFVAEVKTNASPDNEAEATILASQWRAIGFDVRESVLPSAQIQSTEARSTFSGMFTNNRGLGESSLLSRVTGQIPNAGNRWAGSNHGGWSNREYDDLVAMFTSSLLLSEREWHVAQAMRVYTDDLGGISLFFPTQAWAAVAGLRGLRLVAAESNMPWDIRSWQLS